MDFIDDETRELLGLRAQHGRVLRALRLRKAIPAGLGALPNVSPSDRQAAEIAVRRRAELLIAEAPAVEASLRLRAARDEVEAYSAAGWPHSAGSREVGELRLGLMRIAGSDERKADDAADELGSPEWAKVDPILELLVLADALADDA